MSTVPRLSRKLGKVERQQVERLLEKQHSGRTAKSAESGGKEPDKFAKKGWQPIPKWRRERDNKKKNRKLAVPPKLKKPKHLQRRLDRIMNADPDSLHNGVPYDERREAIMREVQAYQDKKQFRQAVGHLMADKKAMKQQEYRARVEEKKKQRWRDRDRDEEDEEDDDDARPPPRKKKKRDEKPIKEYTAEVARAASGTRLSQSFSKLRDQVKDQAGSTRDHRDRAFDNDEAGEDSCEEDDDDASQSTNHSEEQHDGQGGHQKGETLVRNNSRQGALPPTKAARHAEKKAEADRSSGDRSASVTAKLQATKSNKGKNKPAERLEADDKKTQRPLKATPAHTESTNSENATQRNPASKTKDQPPKVQVKEPRHEESSESDSQSDGAAKPASPPKPKNDHSDDDGDSGSSSSSSSSESDEEGGPAVVAKQSPAKATISNTGESAGNKRKQEDTKETSRAAAPPLEREESSDGSETGKGRLEQESSNRKAGGAPTENEKEESSDSESSEGGAPAAAAKQAKSTPDKTTDREKAAAASGKDAAKGKGKRDDKSSDVIPYVENIAPLQRKRVSKFKIGQVYQGKVVSLKPSGIFLDIGGQANAFCHVSRLQDGFVESPEDLYKAGDMVERARVVDVNLRRKLLTVSLQSDAMVKQETEALERRQKRQQKRRERWIAKQERMAQAEQAVEKQDFLASSSESEAEGEDEDAEDVGKKTSRRKGKTNKPLTRTTSKRKGNSRSPNQRS